MAIVKKERDFQLFVKPVGAKCNLGCSYCYYLDNEKVSDPVGVMDANLLETYIEQHIAASIDETVFFSWHGGEPCLAGPGFYKEVIRIQKKYTNKGRKVINGIQTNGTLLNSEWGDFFAANDFVVGISIDGPEELHNTYRRRKNSPGSFKDVINGLQVLKNSGVTYEILCTLNNINSERPDEVYGFFRELDARYITFLPVVEKERKGNLKSWSVKPEIFGDFLIRVFDLWKETDIGKIEIQLIEEAIRTAFDIDHSLCILREECGGVPVLEKNGNVYCCDHYVSPEYLIGNINTDSLSTIIDSDSLLTFGQNKKSSLPLKCIDCDVLEMCNGGCPKNRLIKAPGEINRLNYLCPGYLKFFSHIKPFAKMVAELNKGIQ